MAMGHRGWIIALENGVSAGKELAMTLEACIHNPSALCINMAKLIPSRGGDEAVSHSPGCNVMQRKTMPWRAER